jgi:HTH-type transcriptional regulator/antitoxin HigA
MENQPNTTHPGVILLSELNRRGMKQKELAIRTGLSEKYISSIINGNKDLSSSFARKLDIALGSPAGTWAKKQTDYDEYTAYEAEKNGISDEEKEIFKKLKDVVEYFINTRIMKNHCGENEKILQLRKVLCVHNLTVIPQITYNASYRAQISSSTNTDPYILFAWQRMCELLADRVSVHSRFDTQKLSDSIPSIKHEMFNTNMGNMIDKLTDLFAECGIAFCVVKHFRGAPVQGFIKQTDSGKVILCITNRGKKADRFWFSLFHEIGHLINGDLNIRFVDFESVKTENEAKADCFARDTLIDPTLYKALLKSGKYYSREDIKAFSARIDVPHWIVVGRLHNDDWLDWSYLPNEAPSFDFTKEESPTN